jgi:AcrR family transcriptional regulator
MPPTTTTATRRGAGAPPPSRRTQEERRTATRAALLEATAACLTEHGFAATTTTAVAERAGVSQGALFKHFPSKSDLLAATGEHLYQTLTCRYLDRFQRLEKEADLAVRLDRSIRLLWQMFESPDYAAALDLIIACRTDRELRERMEDVVDRHARRVRAQAASLFPELVELPAFAVTLDLILETMVGMAVSHLADRQKRHYRTMIDHLSELATSRLTAAATATATAKAKR